VDPVVGPEKVDHYELGVKTTPLPGVTLNGAAFWTEIQDFQSTFSDAARSLTYLTNAAKVRSRGGEIDLQADPFKGAWFYASATYADTVYLSYRNAPCPFGVPGVGGTATCDLSGQSLPNAPRWAFAAGGEVARPMAGKEVYVGADWSYKSSFNSAADNSPVGRIDGYSLVNARAGIRLPGGQWDLYGWARNLLNKDYYTRLGVAPFNTGLLVASVGEPRTYGVTGRFRF
jgi:iron complex outermembrane receptor protein